MATKVDPKEMNAAVLIIRTWCGFDFHPNRLINAIKDGVRKTLHEMVEDYGRVTATWRRPPKFYVQPNKLAVIHHSKRFAWLDWGARRFVRVDRNFIAKTQRGWIGSRPGAGDIIRKKSGGARFFRPYNAEGRYWTMAIIEKQIRGKYIHRNITSTVYGSFGRIFTKRPPPDTGV